MSFYKFYSHLPSLTLQLQAPELDYKNLKNPSHSNNLEEKISIVKILSLFPRQKRDIFIIMLQAQLPTWVHNFVRVTSRKKGGFFCTSQSRRDGQTQIFHKAGVNYIVFLPPHILANRDSTLLIYCGGWGCGCVCGWVLFLKFPGTVTWSFKSFKFTTVFNLRSEIKMPLCT